MQPHASLPMLITRTPLRISIGGGGTDLPSYYSRNGGFVISAAIDKYVYIAINRTFTDDYFIKYSALERATSIAEIKHPIVRSALEMFSVEPSIEIVSLADIPAGTGLGSSGSFAVGLVRALHARRREHVTAGRSRRGGVHDRDRHARPRGREAGSVHRGVRRADLLPLRSATGACTSRRSSSRRRRCTISKSTC